MQVDHHDLNTEFPELGDAMRALRASNGHFAKLYDTYHRLTGSVENLESHDMPIADFTLEDMKKERLKLKDQLYHMLQAYRAGQAAAQA